MRVCNELFSRRMFTCPNRPALARCIPSSSNSNALCRTSGRALRHQRKVKVVAIGSSSTAGVAPVLPYPSRLEMRLRRKFFSRTSDVFYGRMIDVLNRGIGGQESPEQLSRLETDVIDEVPVLVVWQVGTNAVYRKKSYNLEEVGTAHCGRTGVACGFAHRRGADGLAIYQGVSWTKSSYQRKWSSA